jgi:hypothetical protein
MTHNNRARLSVQLGGAWRPYWGNRQLPASAEALGTITRGVGDTGALIRTGYGQYMQGNAGVLRHLDQRKIAACLASPPTGYSHGGARPGGGIKPADGVQSVIRKNVTLDQASIDALRKLGDGDLSLGIRLAAAKL